MKYNQDNRWRNDCELQGVFTLMIEEWERCSWQWEWSCDQQQQKVSRQKNVTTRVPVFLLYYGFAVYVHERRHKLIKAASMKLRSSKQQQQQQKQHNGSS